MSTQFRYDGRIQATSGFAIPGVSIAVLTQPANTTSQPGTPLATIFGAAVSNAAAIAAGTNWLAGTINFTFSAAPPADVVAGSYIQVTGVNPSGYNGIWQVVSVVGNVVSVTTPFTLTAIPNPGTYVSGGTVATSALPNPFLSDALGNFFFYAAAGVYTVQIFDTQGRIAQQLVLADQNVVAGGGNGSVTSIALTMPAEFTVTGSPITTAGTLAVTKANQNANLVFAGPTTGVPAAPAFRALVTADMPAGTGTVTSVAATLTVPAIFGSSVTGSPITTSGTLGFTLTLANQSANVVFAGPSSGGAAPPTFRAIVAADLPGTLLQAVSITLSSANILALLGTPINLIVAPGAGFRLVPLTITIVFFGGSVAYTDGGGAVHFQIGATSTANLASNAIFLVTTSPNKRTQVFDWPGDTDTAGNPSDAENQPLQINKLTNNFAAGNGTAKVLVTYLIQPTT